MSSTHRRNFGLRALGSGVGLRAAHLDQIIKSQPDCAWFEVIADDFATSYGWETDLISQVCERYPLVGHGVGLSIGSTDPLDFDYLKKIKAFLDSIKSPWYSDHLCFSSVDHMNINELTPLPFTSEVIANVVERVRVVQDYIERPFLLENITRYMTVSDREMSEAEFITEILERSGCGLLLDITNVWINGINLKFDPMDFIKSLPLSRIGQLHLSGWQAPEEGELIDSHDAVVPEEIHKLFKEVTRLLGPSSVLVEWDKELPPLEVLVEEAKRVEQATTEALVDI